MAKTVQRPAGIEIAAMKTQVTQQGNFMQPGTGTPWEDRGAIGLLQAFFITCARSMTAPLQLWEQIRRPETTGDATLFAILCGIPAGISWVVQPLWWPPATAPLLVKLTDGYDVNWQAWALGSTLQMACAILGMWLLLKLANAFYQKLLPHGIAAKIPPALTYNLLAYSLGPVLLVFIPVVGWMIGLFWVMVLFILVGLKRLRLGAGAAVINGILTVLVVAAVGGGAYLAGNILWRYGPGPAVTQETAETRSAAMMQ